jgi:alpha-beta hydrolase superfamily lysophospholipase
VLVAASARSYRGKFAEAAHHADAVLNVADIARYAPGLGKNVTLVRIEGGKHDLTLSPAKARAELFAKLDEWMRVTPTLGVTPADA